MTPHAKVIRYRGLIIFAHPNHKPVILKRNQPWSVLDEQVVRDASSPPAAEVSPRGQLGHEPET